MRSSIVRFASVALGLALASSAPPLAHAANLTSEGGFLFDIQESGGGYLSNGSIDAYDGCYYLSVGGTTYSPGGSGTLSVDGRTVTLGEVTLGGLRVQRLVYVPSHGGDWARFTDVLTNPGASPITTTVRIYGNLGSDSATTTLGTSSGAAVVSPLDAWFATDDTDGSGDPSLVHFFQGDPAGGALVQARTVSQAGDQIEWTFDVTVAPGASVVFLTFALQGNSQAAVQAEAARLMDQPDDAWAGLDDYEADIVNFPARVILTDCTGARVGARCDDGLFCTRIDRCNAAGACVGAGTPCDDGSACTLDLCDEATDTCSNEMTPNRCLIGGECVADGVTHPAYPCLRCDPDTNPLDWTALPEGTSCGDARCASGRVQPEATCSATGRCLTPSSERCATGTCADDTACASDCEAGCPGDAYCAPSGACVAPRADGSSCADDGQCASGHCVDRLCCDTACDETCRSCRVPDAIGTCTLVPAMTDPDGECGEGSCDGRGACARPDAGVSDAGAADAGAADAGAPDAGAIDAATAAFDAASGEDAAAPPPDARSSGCSAGASGSSSAFALLVVGLALLASRRRRG